LINLSGDVSVYPTHSCAMETRIVMLNYYGTTALNVQLQYLTV